MQTQAYPATFDPMQSALEDMALRHRLETRRVTARAQEFGDVATTLAALVAAGLPITYRSSAVMPALEKPASGAILVVATVPTEARTPASMEILAGAHLQPKPAHLPAFQPQSTVWHHQAGWLLLIHWVPAEQADTVPAASLIV
ncbi:MAG: hypothetical protein Q7J47_03230 [Azoarcus sp.]|nr:hypothetical protein [Azoarcus sp.]